MGVRARLNGLWISLVLVGVLASCAQPEAPVVPIDNTGTAQATLEQVMSRLAVGDVRSVETVMTPRLIQDQKATGGWIEHPQKITKWHLADEDATPAQPGPAGAYAQAVDLRVTYEVASGDSMYPGNYDIWTLVQDGKGRWMLADILGDQAL